MHSKPSVADAHSQWGRARDKDLVHARSACRRIHQNRCKLRFGTGRVHHTVQRLATRKGQASAHSADLATHFCRCTSTPLHLCRACRLPRHTKHTMTGHRREQHRVALTNQICSHKRTHPSYQRNARHWRTAGLHSRRYCARSATLRTLRHTGTKNCPHCRSRRTPRRLHTAR